MCCATEDGTWETRHGRGHPSLRIPADREHQFQSIVIIGSGGHDRVGKGRSAADSLQPLVVSVVYRGGRRELVAESKPSASAEGQGPWAWHAQLRAHLAEAGRPRGPGCHRGEFLELCLPRLNQACPNSNNGENRSSRVLSDSPKARPGHRCRRRWNAQSGEGQKVDWRQDRNPTPGMH
jgi:hypothetical protein